MTHPSGLCYGCHKPTGKAPHAKWCAECWPTAKSVNARIARRRRSGIEVALRVCDDCGQPTGRPAPSRFCLVCKMLRQRARNRTPRYKAYQAKRRAQPGYKLRQADWNERNAERRRTLGHLAYLRRKLARGRPSTKCATYGCEGTFVRPKCSHRMFCTACQVTFYGRLYLASLARRNASRGEWTRRAA